MRFATSLTLESDGDGVGAEFVITKETAKAAQMAARETKHADTEAMDATKRRRHRRSDIRQQRPGNRDGVATEELDDKKKLDAAGEV